MCRFLRIRSLWYVLLASLSATSFATHLTNAVHLHSVNQVRELLMRGATVNEPEILGPKRENPLKIALHCYSKNRVSVEAREDYRKIIDFLLDNGADVNEYYPQPGVINYSILYLAIETYDSDLVTKLLKRGMGPDIIVYDFFADHHHHTLSINHALSRYNSCMDANKLEDATQLRLIIEALVDANASCKVDPRYLQNTSDRMREYLRSVECQIIPYPTRS